MGFEPTIYRVYRRLYPCALDTDLKNKDFFRFIQHGRIDVKTRSPFAARIQDIASLFSQALLHKSRNLTQRMVSKIIKEA